MLQRVTFRSALLDGGHYIWFTKVVTAAELLIGISLILGLFTGLAAFFGGFMNWNFMVAGTASTNPLLFVLEVLLILAWKAAGWWGWIAGSCHSSAHRGVPEPLSTRSWRYRVTSVRPPRYQDLPEVGSKGESWPLSC